MKKLLTLLLAGTVLVGCQNTTEEQQPSQATETSTEETSQESTSAEGTSSEETTEAHAEININVQGEEVASEEVSFEDGTILMDVMEENFDMEIESADFGEFILSIEGHEQDESAGLYWMFDVNGEMAPVGASEYELADGDLVDWHLENTQSE